MYTTYITIGASLRYNELKMPMNIFISKTITRHHPLN